MITWTVTTVREEGGEPVVEFWYTKAAKPRDAARAILEEAGVYDGHVVVAVHAGTCANHGSAFQDGAGRIYFNEGDAARWVPRD
jgi:hypothetical protein